MNAQVSARRHRRLLALALLPLVGLMAACDPVEHPTATVLEPEGSAVSFRLLAAGGQFAVVAATGPGTTVPGAGNWRVDRATGATLALPGAGSPRHISADGRRIVLADNALWTDGATATYPSGAVFSPDLRAVAYRGTDGRTKTQVLPSGPVRDIEGTIVRPGGTTSVQPVAVSDDGSTVELQLNGVSIKRFIDGDAATAVDRADQTGAGSDGYQDDRFALSADGSRFAHHHEVGTYDFVNGPVVQESWVELIDVATGTAVARWDATNGRQGAELRIGSTGEVAWLFQELNQNSPGYCPGSPTYAVCVTSTSAVAVTPGSATVYEVGGNGARSVGISRNGRFLLAETYTTPELERTRVALVDWKADRSEALVAAQTYSESDGSTCAYNGIFTPPPCTLSTGHTRPQISDDFRLVATSSGTGTGWYEFTPAP